MRKDSPINSSANTSSCPVCGQNNSPEALFCSRCTSPIAVVALSELTERDHEICLSRLFQVLADAMANRQSHSAAPQDEDLWQAYLSAFWLRPETAIILYAEAMAIRSLGRLTKGPWLDLGCGDGIHSAIYSGWRFDATFDCFQSLALEARDIYDHWEPKDFHAKVSHPGRMIEYGIDIKPTAIARSKALGIFEKVEQASATQLPLADKSVGTIFSNMLRDLGEPLGAALGECRRVLRDDGVLLISAMTPAYSKHLCFAPAARQAAQEGNEAQARELLRLDRGRSVFCQRQLSIEQWQSLLDERGLMVSSVAPIVGPSIIRFWDVGLRPFSLPLLKQRETWRTGGILEAAKKPAIEFLSHALRPLLRNLTAGESCMNLLAITKK